MLPLFCEEGGGAQENVREVELIAVIRKFWGGAVGTVCPCIWYLKRRSGAHTIIHTQGTHKHILYFIHTPTLRHECTYNTIYISSPTHTSCGGTKVDKKLLRNKKFYTSKLPDIRYISSMHPLKRRTLIFIPSYIYLSWGY